MKMHKRNPDCVNYSECLTNAAILDRQLRCSGCERYRAGSFCADPWKNGEDLIVYLSMPEIQLSAEDIL